MTTLTLDPHPARFVFIRNLLARQPLLIYFVLTFAGGWLPFVPIVMGQDGLGLLPYHVPLWLYVGLFLSATFAGPSLAAFLVTDALEGRTGIKHFLRR